MRIKTSKQAKLDRTRLLMERLKAPRRTRFGPGLERFFELPVEKMGFRYWGEHFRNFGIVLMFATVGSYVATHNREFDPNFPSQGKVIGFIMLHLALVIGAANIYQPFLAILFHARKVGGWGQRAFATMGFVWLLVESGVVLASLSKELNLLAGHYAR